MKMKTLILAILALCLFGYAGEIKLTLDEAAESRLAHGLEHANKARPKNKQLNREQYIALLINSGMRDATNCINCNAETFRQFQKASAEKKAAVKDALK